MSSQKYESVDQVDKPPLSPPGGAPSPYSQPMPLTVIQDGQGYLQQTATTTVVTQPQAINMMLRTRPDDYMAWSIIGCLLCLWPVGIYAIVASCDARSKADSGDFEGAKSSSRCALRINTVNTIIGVIFIITIIAVAYSRRGYYISI